MFVSKREYYEEVHVILQEGVDFTENDLEGNILVGGRLLELTSKARGRIPFEKGYMSMEWSGHYDPETKTVACTLRNPIYIDEETGQVIKRK